MNWSLLELSFDRIDPFGL